MSEMKIIATFKHCVFYVILITNAKTSLLLFSTFYIVRDLRFVHFCLNFLINKNANSSPLNCTVFASSQIFNEYIEFTLYFGEII